MFQQACDAQAQALYSLLKDGKTLVGISTAEQLQYCGPRGEPHFRPFFIS